jgi:hypothetical protein
VTSAVEMMRSNSSAYGSVKLSPVANYELLRVRELSWRETRRHRLSKRIASWAADTHGRDERCEWPGRGRA